MADEIKDLAADLVRDAENRHRENSVNYFDALQRIVGICEYSRDMPVIHTKALKMILRIAVRALPPTIRA